MNNSGFKRGVGGARIQTSNPLSIPRKKGKWILNYETEGGFSLPNGSSIVVNEGVEDIRFHTKLFLSFWLDSDIEVTVEWKSSPTGEWVTTTDSPITVPASTDEYGRTHQVSVIAPFFRISITTTGASPLTYAKISIYGNK